LLEVNWRKLSLYLGASNRNHGKKQRKATGDKSYENSAKFKYLEMITLTKKLLQARRNYEETDIGRMTATANSFPDVCYLKTQSIIQRNVIVPVVLYWC
jgi:hypothetical protein